MTLRKTHRPGIWRYICPRSGCNHAYHKAPGAPAGGTFHKVRLGLERDAERRWRKWGGR